MDRDSLATESAFDSFYGLEGIACDDDGARALLRVRPHHLQPTGIVHGGIYASIAEAVASFGTNWHVTGGGRMGLGMSNATNFLRPVGGGTIHATATPEHQGMTTWVWNVEMRDDEDRLCAVSRVTLAVRRRPG